MKKLALLFAVLLITTTVALARVANPVTLTSTGTQKNVNQENQTNFGSIGAWGGDSTTAGQNGYIVIKGCINSKQCYPYYLWISPTNQSLCMASYATISTFTSFPTGDWSTSNMGCTVVGSQSSP